MRAWYFMVPVLVACGGSDLGETFGAGGSATGTPPATSSSGAGASGGGAGRGGEGGAAPAGGSGAGGSGVGGWAAGGFLIDKSSIALFEQIPANYLAAARDLQLVFSDRSVGQNISEALDCLAASSYGATPISCRRDWQGGDPSSGTVVSYTQSDYDDDLVPAHMRFTPDPVTYDRSNWTFEFRAGSWASLTEDFVTSLAPSYIGTKDVLTYQFSYLNVDAADDIASPTEGFFADTSGYDIHELEAFIHMHPSKVFFFWTTSLARSIGTAVSTDFNHQMRQYAAQNGKILFDFADIVSHAPNGAPCYDNADGIEYCAPQNPSSCENHPDDNVTHPAICQHYTTEIDGGHLGSVSGAKIRAAKAFWVLMARIAGWDP